MGTCNSVDVLDNAISTHKFRGRGRTTIISSYETPITNQYIENKTTYLKIRNGKIEQESNNLADIDSDEDDSKQHATLGRRMAEGQK